METANDEILVAALPRQAFSRLCGACPLTEEEENTTETRKNTEKTEDRHTHLQSDSVSDFQPWGVPHVGGIEVVQRAESVLQNPQP